MFDIIEKFKQKLRGVKAKYEPVHREGLPGYNPYQQQKTDNGVSVIENPNPQPNVSMMELPKPEQKPLPQSPPMNIKPDATSRPLIPGEKSFNVKTGEKKSLSKDGSVEIIEPAPYQGKVEIIPEEQGLKEIAEQKRLAAYPKDTGSSAPVVGTLPVDGKVIELNLNNVDELVGAYRVTDEMKNKYGGGNKSIGNIDLETHKYATNPEHISGIKRIYEQVKDYDYHKMKQEFERLNSPLQYISGQIARALEYYGITPGEFIAVVRQDSGAGTSGRRAIENKNPGNVGNTDNGKNIPFRTWIEGSVAAIRNIATRKVST